MKLLCVVGARPNFMKAASIVDAVERRRATNAIEIRLVHTGQHYDERMSRAFFDDLELPKPDVDLGVGSGSHAEQTGEIMKRFEPVLQQERPDVVLVVGDVNSTAACALVTAKASYAGGTGGGRPLLAHVEAGLRSFDRAMPEEINRVVTDALSDLLFVTEERARANLLREGIREDSICLVGNTMVDTLLRHLEQARGSSILRTLGLDGWGGDGAGPAPARELHSRSAGRAGYAVVTLHRPSNVDDRDTFRRVLDALRVVARDLPVVFPMHPRTMARVRAFGFENDFWRPQDTAQARAGRVMAVDPLGYLEFLCLLSHARLVLTDSGGIQEETTVLGVPCVTIRENTERPVTITEGTNLLVGTRTESIVAGALRQLREPPTGRIPTRWDGKAGERIVDLLTERVGRRG